MAGKTYKTRGLVLRKTKLAEKDLIVTILDESGSLVRAVAKGARRPGGSYAARLELFSAVDLVLAQGRNLDVITGATFADEAVHSDFSMEQTACASVLAELLSALAQENLPHEKLFLMAKAAFNGISQSEPKESLALTCSALLKAFAYAGFRPSFRCCVICGSDADLTSNERIPFSIEDGGITCPQCPRPSDVILVDASLLSWADALMKAKFEVVLTYEPATETLFEILQLVRQWTRIHANKNLKSLDFLLTCGLF